MDQINPHFLSIFICLFVCFVVYSNYNDFLSASGSESSMDLSKSNSLNPIQKNELADYTLLIYMIGSDFEAKKYTATQDIYEMLKAGADSNINIVLQTGGGIQGKGTDIDFTNVQRHKIVNGTLQNLMDLGHKNMAEPNTLSDFLSWGISEFPARKYAIIFWGHGSGVHGFGKDVNFNNDSLPPYELFNGFYYNLNVTGVKFELIGFDSCLMSSLEVPSKLYPFSHYMVASEEIEPEWGWNYTEIIKSLNANPTQSGGSLGKTIIDSYINSSKHLSESEKYGTHHEITLSLTNMTNIPQLVNDVNDLSKSVKSNILDFNSSLSLSKSIDQTEHYGQSALGRSTGLIDLYDFTVNLQDRYPHLISNLRAVQNSINSTILYSSNGDARPNAKGVSIYMPLFKSEYSNEAESQLTDIDWLALLYTQRIMIESDTNSPIIKSIRDGNVIKGSVYGSDIANVFAQIIINSSDGNNLNYIQNIDNSFIDNNGYFSYSDYKMLTLCNETECIPTSVNMESNRDKKFIFIPIRIESPDGNINNNASLVYEVEKDNKFTFLGITPETNPEKTIPKGKTGLSKNDKIFLEARPAKALFSDISNMDSSKFREISEYMRGGPLLVNDPEKIIPQYINISSPFDISFTICDYSDNCDKSRWYRISPDNNSTLIPPKKDQFGYVIIPKNSSLLSQTTINNYTYINPTFSFEINYPSNFIIKIQNMTDFSDYDLSSDPFIVEFIPSEYSEIYGTHYYPSLSIRGTDWPFKESVKALFDYINSTRAFNSTIIHTEEKLISGYPSFSFTYEYLSPSEQYLGTAEEKRIEMVTSIFMDGRMYDIVFGSYASQFYDYLPIIENITNSFREYSIQDKIDINNTERINQVVLSSLGVNDSFDSKQNFEYEPPVDQIDIIKNLRWSKYIDPNYGYKIDYPSNVGIGKPLSMEEFNPALTGTLFTLDNSSREFKDLVTLSIHTFHKDEKDQLRKYFNFNSIEKIPKNFDPNFIISAANETVNTYEMFPDFNLLKNQSLKINNNTAFLVEFDHYNPAARDELHGIWTYITNGQYLSIFEFYTSPQNYEQYFPVFQKMLNSFEFQKE